ncbi:PRD domain-containing protein [Alicyclobacillus macrosporangiidus]|uniref:PRD domain-containing protein n=1 Tax=Alicyclobacillus macrosporangiidus TaxID=392015 RepID=A0A1I7L909_9BACL|nr:PRD domain-containing protein [Alicyclobacillus macrosporangiidus]SFV06203.1 PRD domain-containing protein [Alicyclobacillus macrosporangiidus]
MDETLQERLEILEASHQISPEIRAHVTRFVEGFERTHAVVLGEANAGAFVTHFAIACARLQQGKPVEECPESIAELARRYPELREQASRMFDGIAENATEAEVGFLTMYLCLLLGKES